MEPGMSPLLRIRAERDQMSAIERRIADFLLENAHLLRDYSSQQLASALGVSQSSVVKFSQKVGYKGYPDLKYSIGEAVAREGSGGGVAALARGDGADPHVALAHDLWQRKARAEEETRLINSADKVEAIASTIHDARLVFVIGLGGDGVPARAFAVRLAMLGIVVVQHFDTALMTASTATVGARDVLLVYSELGRQASLCHIAREFRERGGQVISITRHSANPLRAHADASLLVSAHDERPHVEPLLYQSALQHLMDLIYVLLCEYGKGRMAQLDGNAERIRELPET